MRFMASNHTEACTAMRPGCDDEGACDCGYLDSVMREGYQQDYSTPPPAERCPHEQSAGGYCVRCGTIVPKSAEPAKCARCGSTDMHLGQMGSSKCFDCGNIAEAKAPQPEGCIDFPTERKSRAYHSPVFDRAEPAAPSYVCNCGQSFAHEYDRLLHAGDCPSVRKPAAAEVRVWWIDLDEPDIWFTSKGAPTHVIHVIEYSAYQAVCAERDEIAERHEIVSDTNKLKQMTIHELQSQRDQLRRELESLQHKHDGQYAHDTKALHEAHREITALKAENERLRAACKRNPSSGSCIEALSEK